MNKDYLGMVSDFHKTFKVPILEIPQIPSKERCDLRINLMQEELNEIKDAIYNNDLDEVADGFCDLMYVLCGSILEFGLKNNFVELFNEVQRSNISKGCNSLQEAIDTISYYKSKDGTDGYYREIMDKWLVYRKSDDKVLKSINYSPPDIKGILEKHLN